MMHSHVSKRMESLLLNICFPIIAHMEEMHFAYACVGKDVKMLLPDYNRI